MGRVHCFPADTGSFRHPSAFCASATHAVTSVGNVRFSPQLTGKSKLVPARTTRINWRKVQECTMLLSLLSHSGNAVL
ncbi:hypothetical protein GQ600_7155 [Phytophthora cactorum]|nr:hypothetical protein GQ600_7155 [Phytophthora cactorum]